MSRSEITAVLSDEVYKEIDIGIHIKSKIQKSVLYLLNLLEDAFCAKIVDKKITSELSK